MIEWANTIGPECAKVVEKILQDRPHPEMGFRSCLGIIRLAKAVEASRMEAACRRALHYGTCSYRSIKSILDKQLDAAPLDQGVEELAGTRVTRLRLTRRSQTVEGAATVSIAETESRGEERRPSHVERDA